MKQLKIILILIFISFVNLNGCFPLNTEEVEVAVDENKFNELIEDGIKHLDKFDNGDHPSLLRSKSCFSIAKDLNPASPLAYDGLGSVAFREGDFNLAQLLFERSIELDQTYGRAMANLAAVHYREGRYATAEMLLRKAVKLNALDYRAVNNLASVLYNTSGGKEMRKDEGKLNFYKARVLAKEKSKIIEDNIKVVSGSH